MFRWLKKIRREESTPSFGRYFTSRKPWLPDYEDSEIKSQHPHLPVIGVNSTSCIQDHQSEFNILDDPEEHIYEEIDDIRPYSPIQSYTDAIDSLTKQIDTDFGDQMATMVKPTPRDSSGTVNVLETSTNVREELSENKSFDCSYSPETLRCREKCQQWLQTVDSFSPNGFLPVSMSLADSSSEELLNITPRFRPRRSRINPRKMNTASRRKLLKKIEQTWLDSSDDSSEDSYTSVPSDKSSSCVTCSTCRDTNVIENVFIRPTLNSSSENTSGFCDETSTSNKTSVGFELSSNSIITSDSAFSEIVEQLPSFQPKIGFGLNRWYRPS